MIRGFIARAIEKSGVVKLLHLNGKRVSKLKNLGLAGKLPLHADPPYHELQHQKSFDAGNGDHADPDEQQAPTRMLIAESGKDCFASPGRVS